MSGSSSMPSDENVLPCSEWAWAAAMMSGRAAWTWEWMANAATVDGPVALDDLPSWSTQIRSEARICLKLMPNGFTQKRSACSGSRAVMWPATPSSKPKRPKRRNAAARRCLRC